MAELGTPPNSKAAMTNFFQMMFHPCGHIFYAAEDTQMCRNACRRANEITEVVQKQHQINLPQTVNPKDTKLITDIAMQMAYSPNKQARN